MLPFEFIIDGPPVSQQTRRRARLRTWRATVKQAAEKDWPRETLPITEPVMLKVTYFYDRVSIDVDNIIKPIQDALKGLVYVDDDQVTDILSRKRNLNSNFRAENLSRVLAEGFIRGNEFLHIVIEEAPDQEVLD